MEDNLNLRYKPVSSLVQLSSQFMQHKLNIHSDKEGWEDMSPVEIIEQIKNEIKELEDLLFSEDSHKIYESEEFRIKVAKESADIQNFCAFLTYQAIYKTDGWAYLGQM